MQNESLESSFLSVFALITFFIFLIINKYSHKIKNGILFDQDFLKPQAFHQSPVSRSGGIAGIISLNIFLIFYYLIYSNILFEYLFIHGIGSAPPEIVQPKSISNFKFSL